MNSCSSNPPIASSAIRRARIAAPHTQSTLRIASPRDWIQNARCRVSVVSATRAGEGKWNAEGCSRPSG